MRQNIVKLSKVYTSRSPKFFIPTTSMANRNRKLLSHCVAQGTLDYTVCALILILQLSVLCPGFRIQMLMVSFSSLKELENFRTKTDLTDH